MLVLREQDEQRSTEGLEERCDDERKCGLGDASMSREGIDERPKAVARGELGDEWAERRRVHAGGGTGSRRAIVAPPACVL